ncbi:MAG: Asp-tRNA(Asn)/Glu-tRNA(Gln) amidotransferase subunit GatB [Candidatus Bipolaricaulia bacterium]
MPNITAKQTRKIYTIIGLEIHAQLLTRTKIFCGCNTDYLNAAPNANTCAVCLGMPGALPVLNTQAVDYALTGALALNCTILKRSKFDRKNYFYPDLPKGYQISQYDEPLAVDGHLELEMKRDGEVEFKRVGIQRVHLEEDTGKLIHNEDDSSSVDLNRAGVPLIEIVTAPELISPREAVEFMRELRRILRYLGVSDGNMEAGSLRCDANISISLEPGQLGTKTEIKNMNSFKAVEQALAFERERQRRVLEAGGTVVQQTMHWNADTGRAEVGRVKETADDYRYFPEPDLVPVKIDEAHIARLRETLSELPAEKRARWRTTYRVPDYDIKVLTEEQALADYFEAVVRRFDRPKVVSNWMMSELLRLLKEGEGEGKGEGIPMEPTEFAELLELVEAGQINRNTGKTVLEEAFKTGKRPKTIVEEQGLAQISDEAALEVIVSEVLEANPEAVADYRSGNEKVFGFLVGQVMKRTRGQANPKIASQLLRERLG